MADARTRDRGAEHDWQQADPLTLTMKVMTRPIAQQIPDS
jgi:hypothetical protein